MRNQPLKQTLELTPNVRQPKMRKGWHVETLPVLQGKRPTQNACAHTQASRTVSANRSSSFKLKLAIKFWA